MHCLKCTAFSTMMYQRLFYVSFPLFFTFYLFSLATPPPPLPGGATPEEREWWAAWGGGRRPVPQKDSQGDAGERGDDFSHEREKRREKRRGEARAVIAAASPGTVARSVASTPSPPFARSLPASLAPALSAGGRTKLFRKDAREARAAGQPRILGAQPEVAAAFRRRDATGGRPRSRPGPGDGGRGRGVKREKAQGRRGRRRREENESERERTRYEERKRGALLPRESRCLPAETRARQREARRAVPR